mmetsp:Transcript_16233/g.21350  ORF Transcript_16233/g.21350 Transcript_16233/m.21350 type:complete len:231 (+) Transcript_16233:171-863(+)
MDFSSIGKGIPSFDPIIVCLALALILIYSIYPPTIIEYPWPTPDRSNDGQSAPDNDKEKTVAIAGSFNPPHKGHFALLEYLASRYGKVIIIVGKNMSKKYDVGPEDRAAVIQEYLEKSESMKNARVEVVTGLVWKFAKREGASLLFRGIRTWAKDGANEIILNILNTVGPVLLGPLVRPIPTVFIEGDPAFNDISSTKVRKVCSNNELLVELVPPEVKESIMNMYGKKMN